MFPPFDWENYIVKKLLAPVPKSKVLREIIVAIKEGGDMPEKNFRLQYALHQARAIGLSDVVITQTFQKALAHTYYFETIIEVALPHNVSVLLECATENLNLTQAQIRQEVEKNNGSICMRGELSYGFSRVGILCIPQNTYTCSDDFSLQMIEAGAEMLLNLNNYHLLLSTFENFGQLRFAIFQQEIEIKYWDLARIPSQTIDLTADELEAIQTVIENLYLIEGVQKVYHNVSASLKV